MAVPYSRIRAVMGGRIGGTQTWSTGITVVDENLDNLSPVQALLDTWIQNRVVNVRDFWTAANGSDGTIAQLLGQATNVSFLRAYLIPANSDSAVVQSEASFGGVINPAGAGHLPTQTCMVVSTRSQVPGRSGRGRMYLPATGCTLVSPGLFSETLAQTVATRAAQLLEDFGTSSYSDARLRAVVASTAGAREIIRVEVDNEPDIQRRRADKIAPTVRPSAPVEQ